MNNIKKIVIVTFIYTLICFIFYSRLIYRPASSLISYHTLCIFFGIILLLVTNTFFVHAKRKDFLIAALITLVLIYAVPFIFDVTFGGYLKRYYVRGGGRNLLGFPLFLLQEFLGK